MTPTAKAGASHRNPPPGRDAFASTLGAFAATLGSAIGLGNIWKFPYLTGSNGGAAFVLIYLLSIAFVGLPVLVAEHTIGRKMRQNAVHAYGSVVPGQKFWAGIGLAGVLAAFLIMAFYTDVAGWVFAYVFKSFGAFVSGRPWAAPTSAPWPGAPGSPCAGRLGVLALTTAIIAAGVSKGIEKVTKTLMPLLFILLIICDIRALTLPGAAAGVAYLFRPDLTKVTATVLLWALGLAFFKLSLGMGTMTTYGSYLPDSTRIVPNATRVALADTRYPCWPGLAIFPAVFAFGGTPAGGPGLLFNTIPLIFSQMPLGGLFTMLFFVLTAIATIGAMVSILEVPVAWLIEKGHPGAAPPPSSPAGSCSPWASPPPCPRARLLAGVKVFGKNFFDLFDFASSNVLLPVGGLAIAVVGGWLISRREFRAELNKGYAGEPWHGRLVYGIPASSRRC